jgi:acetyl-CoA/propionyl-CoA carboxylase biotin carboxyl carrier protein
MAAALATARREARGAFGDDTLFLERFVLQPRHIEVQVMADTHGTVIHLGERECSLQRRHQKIVEEAPSALLDAVTRARIGEAAVQTARSVGYVGAGTVEFIVSAERPDDFFFMEMNTRLQVEHPVTEAVTGLDLVELQLRVAAGEPLGLSQSDVVLTGHAVETRIYAEDPARGFLPTGGRVLLWDEPADARVDSGISTGSTVGSDYDPMLAKVIAWGTDRADALQRLDVALAGTTLLGVTTNVGFLRRLLGDPDVRSGHLDTGLVERRLDEISSVAVPREALLAAAAVLWPAGTSAWSLADGWRMAAEAAPLVVRLDAAGDVHELSARREELHDHGWRTAVTGRTVWVGRDGEAWAVAEHVPAAGGPSALTDGVLRSPMPGTVIAVHRGGVLGSGDPVVVIEAMKMEHALTAPFDGTAAVTVAVGDQVRLGQVLATVEPAEGGPTDG